MYLEIQAPVTICRDTHGQYTDLLRLFEVGAHPPETNYLFLGKYLDRGKQSIETISLLMAYTIKNPFNFFFDSINRIYGFYDEFKRRYNVKLWKLFIDLFNELPVASFINNKILLVHDDLSLDLNKLQQFSRINKTYGCPRNIIIMRHLME